MVAEKMKNDSGADDRQSALSRHIPNLDGVRALAILMVLAYHLLALRLVGQSNHTFLWSVLRWTTGPGWLGVDLFFVLSGYLITTVIRRGIAKPDFYPHFYARRSLRIIPLYLLVLTALAIYYATPLRWWVLCAFFGANLSYVFGFTVPGAAFPFWSLAVEEQFYLFWPAVARNVNRKWGAIICVAIFILEPLLRFRYFFEREMDVYVATWFRLDGLAMGALLALYCNSRFRSRLRSFQIAATCVGIATLGIAALAKLGALSSLHSPFATFRSTLGYLLFAALILAAIELPRSLWTAPLRTRFAVETANLSYCIYLVHMWCADLLDRLIAVPKDVPSTVLRAGEVVLISYAIAVLSRKYIELPFLRMKFPSGAKQAAKSMAAVAQ